MSPSANELVPKDSGKEVWVKFSKGMAPAPNERMTSGLLYRTRTEEPRVAIGGYFYPVSNPDADIFEEIKR